MITKNFETEFGGEKLKVEISNLANQANGSVLVRYGETAVFATAVISNQTRDGLGYFPLTVDYEERYYAAGMILGSRFVRREGRPSEEAVLTGRMIDRTIRPLFDKRIRNDVQVVVIALSIDSKNDPDVPAVLATSLALGISDIPWNGPVGAVRIASAGGEFMVNPTHEKRLVNELDTVVCGKGAKINMIETFGKEAPEELIAKAFELAVKEISKIEEFQKEIIKEMGKEKIKFEFREIPENFGSSFKKHIAQDLEDALFSKENIPGKKPDLDSLKSEWIGIAKVEFGEEFIQLADDYFDKQVDDLVHDKALNENKRSDGRKMDEVRPLEAHVKILPLLHGSGIFFRGGTHVLSVVTLGGPADVQLIQGMEIQTTKHFMHHYNFPPFSSGETGRMGSPGRREIGHGALAEKALLSVIPTKEEFPYTIRVVSESMASNGSTSQASICASTLALMDAGVPIKAPVAGIAVGLMMKNDKEYKILTDIQGPEDHHGDMDFKCAGTRKGVTAIQMDVKVEGVTLEMLEKALVAAKQAREQILNTMQEIIAEPRTQLSEYAPRILKFKINPDKIREVIGPGGKMINSIIEKTGVQIDIEQDGTVFITGKNHKDTDEALKIIDGITHEYEVGEFATGPVTRLFEFGAMVEIGPMQEGLIHISELSDRRVGKVTDIVNPGDVVTVKVVGIDEKGRINLSLRQANTNYSSELDQKNNNNNYERPIQPRKTGHGGHERRDSK